MSAAFQLAPRCPDCGDKTTQPGAACRACYLKGLCDLLVELPNHMQATEWRAELAEREARS